MGPVAFLRKGVKYAMRNMGGRWNTTTPFNPK